MNDAQIIELYWQRSEQAISASDNQYGRFCRRIAMNILNNAEDSEECVNDTWHRAWDNMPPQKPNILSAFFGRITRNLSLSRFRLNHAQKRYDGMTLLLSELEDCIPSKGSIEQETEERYLAEVISDWLASIPRDDRILFVRRYWFGDMLKDLAKECGTNQNQMAQRVYRLRNALKSKLEQEGISL